VDTFREDLVVYSAPQLDDRHHRTIKADDRGTGGSP
jgi:hypothetical protein